MKIIKICEKIEKLLSPVTYGFAVFSGSAVVAMVVFICADVISRNLFKTSVGWAYAIVQNACMPLSFFLAIPIAYRDGVLPKVNNLLDRGGKSVRIVGQIIIFALEVIIFWLFFRYGLLNCQKMFAQRYGVEAGGILLRVYPVFLTIPIGFFLTLVYVFLERIKGIAKIALNLEGTENANQVPSEE